MCNRCEYTAGGVGCSAWLDAALRELEKVDTVKLAVAKCPDEANAVGNARVMLDRARKTRGYRISNWWHDLITEPRGQDGLCGI